MPEDLAKILLAVLIGGLIGAEREYRAKAAGFRTIILICVGATLFTILSIELGKGVDTTRIAASIVTGVGFLGAGAIIRGAGGIAGLTTASTIWLAAALGMGIGGGFYVLSSFVGGLVLIVLLVFPRIEKWIDNVWDSRTYVVESRADKDLYEELENVIAECGLGIRWHKREKAGAGMVCTWTLQGSPKGHNLFIKRLFDHPEVMKFGS
jgi:putative Mg2+ transporter-C (MgtC) family protein